MAEVILWTDMHTGALEIEEMIRETGGRPRYFRIDTSLAKDPSRDLMSIAVKDKRARQLLLKLTNLGYYTYYNTDNETRLIRHDRVRHHWRPAKGKKVSVTEDDIFYTYTPPVQGSAERLLVVLSHLSSKPRLIRYFWPSWNSLAKYVAPGTAILRVGDFGGVKGAYYMDTTFLKDNSRRIQQLVRRTAMKHVISEENIVVYGASKGGTGAVYHGVRGGWKFVATDPILSDAPYQEGRLDKHFDTGGAFPRVKEEVFDELLKQSLARPGPRIPPGVIVTSSRSPEYQYTQQVIAPVSDEWLVLNSTNRNIQQHADVSKNTLYAQTTAINSLLLGLELPRGHRLIP